MSETDYIKQLEQTVESLQRKLDEATYFKPMWSQEVIPGRVSGKKWVIQLQGNPVCDMYKKKALGYKGGTPKQRSRWANATIEKELICSVTVGMAGRCIPYIFGREYEWQKNMEECKKYVNRIVFGVDEI
jgi:hypothetical protein